MERNKIQEAVSSCPNEDINTKQMKFTFKALFLCGQSRNPKVSNPDVGIYITAAKSSEGGSFSCILLFHQDLFVVCGSDCPEDLRWYCIHPVAEELCKEQIPSLLIGCNSEQC